MDHTNDHPPMRRGPSPIRACACLEGHGILGVEASMAAFLLWLVLLVICWPLAIAFLVLYPLIWLLLLPFRILGFAVEGAFGLVRGLFLLPGRLLR